MEMRNTMPSKLKIIVILALAPLVVYMFHLVVIPKQVPQIHGVHVARNFIWPNSKNESRLNMEPSGGQPQLPRPNPNFILRGKVKTRPDMVVKQKVKTRPDMVMGQKVKTRPDTVMGQKKVYIAQTQAVLSKVRPQQFSRNQSNSVTYLKLEPQPIVKNETNLTVYSNLGNRQINVTSTAFATLEARKSRVSDVCSRIGRTTGVTSEISGYQPLNFSYCIVQKAGCTSWIRVFKFMHGQRRAEGNPMLISKYETHNTQKKFFHLFYSGKADDSDFIYSSYRAMTVRDPYTRLWSAYVDKFVLPDFWTSKGKEIVRKVRYSPSSLSLQCGHDVTFPEFIRYVIQKNGALNSLNQDKHWLPASSLCDPCIFKPDVIGKQESFLSDMSFILQHIGLEHLLKDITSIKPVEYEIHDEVDYCFNILRFHLSCVNREDLIKRIWYAFQLNGYIPPSYNLTSAIADLTDGRISLSEFSAKTLSDLVIRTRTHLMLTKTETKKLRMASLQKAFSELSITELEALQRIYKMDFELFDYNSKPDYLRFNHAN